MARRMLLVTRRFWPLCSPPESRLLQLMDAWRRHGAVIRVATPQWDRSWPTKLEVREMPVSRIPHSPRRLWGDYWYLKRLQRWLSEHRSEFDQLVVWRMRLDALAVLRASEELGVPAVVLYEGCGELGDAAWLKQSPHRERILEACRRAAAICTFSDAAYEEVQRLGMPPERCLRLDSIEPPIDAKEKDRSAARMRLLESNRDFFTTPATPVGLVIGPLEGVEMMRSVFEAWSRFRDVHDEARLWWIGDGSRRSSLYSMLGDYELRYHGVLPGEFDDWDELLTAADLFLAPHASCGAAALRALAAGRPVIAADSADLRSLLPASAPVQYVRAGDAAALAEALLQAFGSPSVLQEMASAVQSWAASLRNEREVAREHLELIEERCRRCSLAAQEDQPR